MPNDGSKRHKPRREAARRPLVADDIAPVDGRSAAAAAAAALPAHAPNRNYYLPLRRSLNSVIAKHNLSIDINSVASQICAIVDAACDHVEGTEAPNISQRLLNAVPAIVAALQCGDAAAAHDFITTVRPSLNPVMISPPAPPREEAAVEPAKRHRAEEALLATPSGLAPSNVVGTAGVLSVAAPPLYTAAVGGPGLMAPPQAIALVGAPLAAWAAPPPRGFPAPQAFAPRLVRNIVLVNLPPEFNQEDLLSRLVQFHTGHTVRCILVGYPAATAAFLRVHTVQDGQLLISLGASLVDGYPAIRARAATTDETKEGNERLCAPVRELEAHAHTKMAAVEAAYEAAAAAAAAATASATSTAADPAESLRGEIADVKKNYEGNKTEMELLVALGPVADSDRKMEVLRQMKSQVERIRQLEQRLAAPPSTGIAAAVVPKVRSFSSSKAGVSDPEAVVYLGPCPTPLHDDLLLALLSPLPIHPKRIWRSSIAVAASQPQQGAAGEHVCIEAAAATEVATLVELLYPSFGSFCGFTFSRRPPPAPAVVKPAVTTTSAAAAPQSSLVDDVQALAQAVQLEASPTTADVASVDALQSEAVEQPGAGSTGDTLPTS